MIIYVDLDGTIVDIIQNWLSDYNFDYDDNLTEEDIIEYGLDPFVKEECGMKIYDYLANEGFFTKAKPELDAIELIGKLNERGHDIFFATKTPLNSRTAFYEKCQWVDLHVPIIGKEKVISIRQKGLLKGDCLIEDYEENLRIFEGLRILIDRPWNRHVKGDWFVRCKTWKEVEEIIEIEEFSKNLQRRFMY